MSTIVHDDFHESAYTGRQWRRMSKNCTIKAAVKKAPQAQMEMRKVGCVLQRREKKARPLNRQKYRVAVYIKWAA
jgi:hypothetical protein